MNRFIHQCLSRFGPFTPLALFLPAGLLILSLSRTGLALWLSDRITASGIGWTTFFLQGVRADLIQVSLFSIPLVINSTWSVYDAIYNLKHEARSSEIYGKLSPEEILRETNLWTGEDQLASESPLSRWHQAAVKRDRPLNLVIVLEESLGAGFVKSLGGNGMTPELDRLAGEGWWFENLYATGTRSVRGIEAVVSGFLPTPARSVVKLSMSQTGFFTIAELLRSQGYGTEFIYGGESHFDNMKLFFSGNGFEEFTDQNDFDEPVFRGTWGVSDEDLFRKADKILQRRHQSGQPFFSLIFTSSNHCPFEFPEGRISPEGNHPATVDNAVKYADFALGQFIENAKSRNYWKNTLFLIVADHDTRAFGRDLVPIKNFHIPGLILGADLSPKKVTRVASQIDLPVTLLSLMGLSANHPMVGTDHAQESGSGKGRAFMQFSDNFCMMEGEEVVILQAQKEPVFGRYDRASHSLALTDSGDKPMAKRALAYSLLPAWLYRARLYH